MQVNNKDCREMPRNYKNQFKRFLAPLLGFENITIFVLIRFFLYILIISVTLHFLGFISIPIAPFTTKGAIYVDSPEVYTRERLVNDRYDQDYWLREQLRELDKTQSLLTARIDRHFLSGNMQSSDAAVSTKVAPVNLQQESLAALPFDQDFRIRAAIRDAIRQLMLENMLDDRHDLTGNSVYGLKFDTTVIPGSNTRKRAFVRVKLMVDDLFKIDPKSLKLPSMKGDGAEFLHARAFFLDSTKDLSSSSHHLYHPNHLYKDWIASIQERLNASVSDKFRSDSFRMICKNAQDDDKKRKLRDDTIREMLELVLGIDSQTILIQASDGFENNQIHISPPWSKFIFLTYKEFQQEADCNIRPIFEVFPRWDFIEVVEDEQYEIKHTKMKENFKKYSTTPKNRNLWIPAKKFDYDDHTTFDFLHPVYNPNDAVIDIAKDALNLKNANRFTMDIPSGLFNFIESIGRRDIYSYAIFPKNEVVGILSKSSIDLALSTNVPNSPWLNFVRGLQESQIESTLVGFGDPGDGDSQNHDKLNDADQKEGRIEFGWVISMRGKMEPTQKTQLALLSVPAWTSELKLEITTGWLNRNAHEQVESYYDLRVPVPPDFDAFDSLLAGRAVQRKPKILDNLMDSNIKLSACENAKVLIPGSRLWRSAAVTLGPQKADRIMVLPNMEGIIAVFQPVEIPPVRTDEGGNKDVKIAKVKLRVWTSEGIDTAEREVEVVLPITGKCNESNVSP